MITVLALARYRELLGFSQLSVPLPDPPTMNTLLGDARFSALPAEGLIALNQAFTARDTTLRDGDEVALMPPVSGG